MLFITHDLELAAAICDRTAVMYAGQIVEIRASARLHDDPLHPYTAALAAARPGHRADGRTRLRAIPGRPLSAFEAPAGQCAFAPRCADAQDACRDGLPEITELDGGLSALPPRATSCAGQLGGGAGRTEALTGGRDAPILEVTWRCARSSATSSRSTTCRSRVPAAGLAGDRRGVRVGQDHRSPG